MSGSTGSQGVSISGNSGSQSVTISGTTGTTSISHTHTLNTTTSPAVTGAGISVVTAVSAQSTDPSHSHSAGTLAGTAHLHTAGTLAGASHTHGVGSLATVSASNLPAYFGVILCEKD
jgi:hypothetical protein